MEGAPGARTQPRPLRIAMVVPPWYEMPPPGYGGLEQVAAGLVDALTGRGHQVTVFGVGGRTGTSGRFRDHRRRAAARTGSASPCPNWRTWPG